MEVFVAACPPVELRMCHRRVAKTMFSCGHQDSVDLDKEDCTLPYCRYSRNHIQTDHICEDTCRQWMGLPQTAENRSSPEQCQLCSGRRR
ncbi:hypothetical protein BGW80DRAFT_1303583 [Lactifluus volemus]|nr:hypothetical protein BGW80DRAFT_1303583 [Lactifluus volemus]